MMKSRKEADEKIAAMLNADQKEKFIALQKKHQELLDRQQRDDRHQQNDRGRMGPGNRLPLPPEEFIGELKRKLNLTSEQEAKIQKIFDIQNDEMKKTFESEKITQKEISGEMNEEHTPMREKLDNQRKEIDTKISAVLTDEQKKKFGELQNRHPQPPGTPGPDNDRPMRDERPDHQE
jgi:Spy/CpxP family protein refolding chaperone